MPNSTKREFADFSSEVAKGSKTVSDSLNGVSSSAGQADDKSHGLSETQKIAQDIAKNYAEALDKVDSAQKAVKTSAEGAATNVFSLGSATSTAMAGVSGMAPAYANFASALTKFQTSLTTLSGVVATSGKDLQDLLDAQAKAAVPPPVKFTWLKDYNKELRKLKVELKEVDKGTIKMRKEEVLLKSVFLAERKAVLEFVEGMDEAKKATFELEVTTKGLEKAISDLKADNDDLADSMEAAADAANEAATAEKDYFKSVDKAASVTDLLKNKLAEGEKEAKQFASGIGVGNGMMMAGGVAMVYMAKKASELIDEFQGAAMASAEFNLKIASMARAEGFPGKIPGGLRAVRDGLGMTMEQSDKFFDVLKMGVATGVVSANELVQAGMAIKETFGGDATERLREYVELLEKIPTIKTDLMVSAKMDDQAASIFALAKEGKMGAVINLQAAGLAGGAAAAPLSPGDVELINAAQKAQKQQEDLKNFFIKKAWPQMWPKIGNIAKYALGTMGLVGGMAATAGLIAALMFKQVVAQDATTAAILATSGSRAAAKAVDVVKSKTIMEGLAGMWKSVKGGAGAGAGKAAAGYEATSGALGKMLSTTQGKLMGFTFAAVVAGIGLKVLSSRLSKSDKEWVKTTGAVADLSGDVLNAGATIAGFATIGTMILPGLGTALGAVAGAAVVGVEMWSKSNASMFKMSYGMERVAKGTKGLQESLAGVQKKEMLAGLALERHMKALDNEFGSAKFQLAAFRKDIAMMDMEQLGKIGGTAGRFNYAVTEATNAVKDKFQGLNEALSRQRVSILKDATLTGPMRAMALEQLHKYELDATKEFVDAMGQVIDALFQTPALIAAGLKQKAAKQRIEFGMDVGGAGLDAFEEDLNKVREASSAAGEEAAKAFEKAKEAAKATRAEVESKKGKAVAELGGPRIDAEQATKNAQDAADELSRLQLAMDMIRDEIPTESFVGLVDAMEKTKSSIAKIKESVKSAKGEEAAKLMGEQAEAEKELFDQGERLRGVLAQARVGEDQRNAMVQAVVTTGEKGTKLMLAQLDGLAATNGVSELIAAREGKGARAALEQRDELQKQYDAQVRIQELNATIADTGDASNIEAEGVVKGAEKYLEQMKGVREAVKMTGNFTDVALKDSKREQELLEKQAEIAALIGNPIEATIAIQENINKQYAVQADAIKRGRKVLDEEEAKAKAILANIAPGEKGKAGEARVAAETVIRDVAEQRKKFAIEELDMVKKTVDLSDQLLENRKAEVDLQGGMIEAEISMLEATGGHYSRVLELQQKSIGIERERLGLMKDRYAKMEEKDKLGLKGRTLAADIVKQEYEIRKKEMGIQKDIFEKILGKAFGELQGAGAMRGRFTDAAVMGRAATRRVTEAGLYAPSKPGEVKTKAQAQAERTLGGKGGGMFGGFGPERLPVEKEMAAALNDNLKETKKSNEILAQIRDATTPGKSGGPAPAAPTGDKPLPGGPEKPWIPPKKVAPKLDAAARKKKELDDMFRGGPLDDKAAEAKKAKEIEDAFGDVYRAADPKAAKEKKAKEIEDAFGDVYRANDPKAVEAKKEKEIEDAFGDTPKAVKARTRSEKAQDRSGSQRVPSAANVENAPGFAGVAGAAGGGGAAADAGTPALKFVGELTVKFNHQMFQTEVVQIIGNAINTGEVRKAMEKSGVLYR